MEANMVFSENIIDILLQRITREFRESDEPTETRINGTFLLITQKH